ncbi:phospholipid-translocating p-type flippase family protein, putative [Ichthyophthirius multifiliis]|uniref:Phospholipid-transporting ATPase n=1 Tax=Ichthyophthirius multifiliis TaxID=5932 RepID=G0QQF8_ICHMU|nr:phospholipid-translocating p-type flippase family protein, putative [Ichthyophthirius multifiliis]EGR32551.1 phospholipid-translocating p-type flippase family protein, putative [Ichthyophthirius multifiliis]|eukprot:XP_004036537.1 phospholipid-translocating p-type flippase family protein, putative [Ichthyophthirius multifiliis]
MNQQNPQSKFGKFDEEVNQLSKVLFYFMCILSFLMIFFNGFSKFWFIQYFRYLLLLSSIIPISLRVNNDFAKSFFSYRIQNDPVIKGTVARNSNIPEELGRIQYLLADKTGTLTQNDMIFKKIVINEKQYTIEDLPEIKNTLIKMCQKFNSPLPDIENGENQENKKNRRKNELIIRDVFTALSVCHNVTPVIENGEKTYQASSPDEHALVKFSESLNMRLEQRSEEQIVILNANNTQETFLVLAIFPFTSETKSMGILLRHQPSSKIIYYLKGADTIMMQKVNPYFKSFVNDDCDNLAREGLRTLVFAQKCISEEFYAIWKEKYKQAQESLQDRNQQIRNIASELETNMELIGITGVEDKLQEEVCNTIENLRQGGIKVWMLTGDKVETAKCIAVSAGLKSVNQEIFEIIDQTDEMVLREMIQQFSHKANCVLLIDGTSLCKIISSCDKLFFETATQAPSVICCRCAPKQKASVTECIKKYTNKRVLCVGDGGNDVGMIQCAHVGVGIVGKEGKQAALASDFSILEFRYLKCLLLWHGRNSYKKATTLSLFVIHRGLIISIIQMIFSSIFYFVAIPIYNGMLMLGYATFYTSLPVFCLIFDEDISQEMAFQYPQLYTTLQKNRKMNTKTSILWIWISIYQGSAIMFLAVTMFQDTFLSIITITFTALIFIELLNVYSQVKLIYIFSYLQIQKLHKLHMAMIISQLFTFLTYLLSILFLNNYINTEQITSEFFVKVLLICAATWLPLHTFRVVQQYCYPNEEKKIMRQVITLKDFISVFVGFLVFFILLFLYQN